MLPAGEVQRSITGAWRLMLGRPDGLKLLDLSGDGFWNSFFAIVVSLPALLVSWVAAARDLPMPDASIPSIVLRLAVIDLSSWVVPLAGFVLIAPMVGLRDRVVHYVVATNWGSIIMIWLSTLR